jgi:hypothetical protein
MVAASEFRQTSSAHFPPFVRGVMQPSFVQTAKRCAWHWPNPEVGLSPLMTAERSASANRPG